MDSRTTPVIFREVEKSETFNWYFIQAVYACGSACERLPGGALTYLATAGGL
jgi:hypothetical protein